MAFGHVLKAEQGRNTHVPLAYDGVVYLNVQLLQGVNPAQLPRHQGGGDDPLKYGLCVF